MFCVDVGLGWLVHVRNSSDDRSVSNAIKTPIGLPGTVSALPMFTAMTVERR